jgi:hypothetical protein
MPEHLPEQLMLATVEAMFAYLDTLEDGLGTPGDSEINSELRARLGLPRYRFVDRPCPSAVLSCGAHVKFVFLGTSEGKRRAAAVDLKPGGVPAATINDPDACRRKGLCFPNLVRQQFKICDQDLVVIRNVAPYGRHHGVIRSLEHEPQSSCFEPFRLAVALTAARSLGSETGPSAYEVWVAGEGFNTQWHYHIQFRKQRGPIWKYINKLDQEATRDTGLLEEYPSRPMYFCKTDREELIHALHRELLKCSTTTPRPSMGILVSYEEAQWRVLLVKSWYPQGERLFGKQPGLHEHLGEVILESDDEFRRVQADLSAAAEIFEERLAGWCRPVGL